MANIAKNAILRAKIAGQITDIMVKTTTSQVYVNETTTLAAHLATLAEKATLEQLQQTVANLGALAQKDKVSYADLEEALAALIDGKAEASALTEEIDRAKAAEEALTGRLDDLEAAGTELGESLTALSGTVATLIGEDTGKSARAIAAEELAAKLIPENAAESLNELTEIAAWIQSHPNDAAAMNAAITALQNKVDTGDKTVSAYVTAAIAALKIGDYAKAADLTALAGRVEALEQTAEGLGDLAVKDLVAEADLEEELKAKVNAAAEGNHAHANKEVLDGISAENVTAWNGKANIYYSAEEPANLTEYDLWVALVD